jgi:pimeloyl-ACP methyl ester carboxylesterase
MTTWQGGDVEAQNVRLHYTRTGGDRPPLVLAHGVTDDGLCWTPVAEALAAEYDVIMVDARGHGRSSAPEQGYGPAEQAEDLRAVIAALGLERPAILGHSMGAATTLVLAGTYPDVPGKILLEDPPAWWMPAPAQAPAGQDPAAGMRAWMLGLKSKTRDELIAQQRAETPGWSEAELGPWADAKLMVSPNVAGVFGGASASVDWAALLPRITCPALLITGDPPQGAIVTREQAGALNALVPQLEVAHIARSGHNIRRDQFERFLEVVRAFLKR